MKTEFDFDRAAVDVIERANRPANPVDMAAQQVVDGQRTALRSTLYNSLLADPNVAARAQKLGRSAGIPAEVVERNFDEVQRNVQLEQFDRVLRDSPTLAQWLTEQNNAKVSHDDVENLGALEKIARSAWQFGRSVAAGAQGMPADLVYGGGRAIFETAAPLLDPLAGTILPENPLRRVAAGFAGLQRDAQAVSRNIQGDTSGLGFVEQAVNQGARSLGGNLATLPLALMGGGSTAMLAPMVGSEFGRSYGEARDKGVGQPQALAFGASQAAIEYATEKIPVSRLLGDLKVGTSFGKMLARQVAAEIPGEQVATVLQDLNEWAVLNPAKPFKDYLAERPSAFAQTLIATMVGAGGQVTTVKAIEAAVRRFDDGQLKVQAAQDDAKVLQSLVETVGQSKLRERDAQTFERFMAQVNADGPVQTLFIQAETLAQELGPNLEAVVQAVPALREQLDEALTAQGTVAIPVEQFAAYVPPEVAQALVPHLRTSEEGMSLRESETFAQEGRAELQAEIEAAANEPEAIVARLNSLEIVREAIGEQLKSAGRFTPDVNNAYGELLLQFFQASAERTRMDVADLYNLIGPRIVSQLDMSRPAQTLEQGDPDASLLGAMVNPDGTINPAAAAGTDGTMGQADGRRGAYDPATRTIALLSQADLSTFIHEAGHYFLEVQTELAARPDAPAGLRADAQIVLDWFGVPDLATWQAMTLEQKRPFHEQFARGFEAYAFEGEAPSQELQSVFQRFRGWLLRVYRSLTALRVDLSDDVRAVFGRMLATEEQIKNMEAIRRYRPLFESAEAAGMTPEEWADYQAAGVQATTEAVDNLQRRSLRDMQWLANARSRALRKLQREAKDKRTAVQAEVEAEARQMPEFAAQRWLKTGELPDGTKLSGKALADMYGDGPATPRRYLSTDMIDAEGGMHPDEVAEVFVDANGERAFDSGDAMVRAIVAAGKESDYVEAETDRRMLERYGDLSDPQTIARAADELIHNEARARFLEREVNALGKAVGSRPILARAAREFAEAAIARKKVREIKPSQYSAAEARAARAAEAAFKKGDTTAAAVRKREQLLQNQLSRVAHRAIGEVGRAVDYLAKFDTDATRKAIGAEYADQIDALLERFDLRPRATLKQIDRRKTLLEWVESQREAGLEPNIDERLLADAKLVSVRDMTLEELRGLVDTVKNIEHLGRLKQKLLTVQDQRRFDELVAEAAQSIEAHGGKAQPLELEGRKGLRPWLQGVLASHRKIASLVRQMDGGQDGGPMWRILVRGMNDAGTREQVMTEQATMTLAQLYAPLLKLKGGLAGAKVFIPEIGASLSRGGRLAVALNWGNEVNRQRMLDGEGWSPAQVGAILRTLGRTELDFVNQAWEYLDSYWPQIEAKAMRVDGIAPDKVAAEPFTLTLADGSTMLMRGGYYPLKYDADRSSRAESLDAAEVAKDMMRGAFTRSTTRRGHTKARAEIVKRPIRKDLDVITQHVTQVVHDLAWHEWLIDANRLIGAKPIDQAIRTYYGPDVVRTLKDNLAGIATGDLVSQTAIDRALRVLRANVTRSTMGLSFTTALLQPFGLTQSMARIGVRPVLRGVARWAGDAARLESSMQWIGEKSDFMRLRAKTFNRELNEIAGRVSGQSTLAQVRDGVLFGLTTKMQLVADVPTWIGQYEKALEQGASEATAIALADQAVLDAQGGGQIKDLAEVQRKHPFLTQFYSYFSTTLNLVAESTATTDFKNPRAVAGWLTDMALLAAIPAIAPMLVLSMLRGDDDDELAKQIAQAQVGYLLGLLVGVRELSGMVSGYPYNGPPVSRVVTDTGKAATQVAQGELDEPAVLAIVRLLGTALGIPTTQAIRSYRGWVAWTEGNAPATAVLFGPPPKD